LLVSGGLVSLSGPLPIQSVSQNIPLLTYDPAKGYLRGVKQGPGMIFGITDSDIIIGAAPLTDVDALNIKTLQINNFGQLEAFATGLFLEVPSSNGYKPVLTLKESTVTCNVELRVSGLIGATDSGPLQTAGDLTVRGDLSVRNALSVAKTLTAGDVVTAKDFILADQAQTLGAQVAALQTTTRDTSDQITVIMSGLGDLANGLQDLQTRQTQSGSIGPLQYFADDKAALAGGVPRWSLYRNGNYSSSLAMRSISDAPEYAYSPVINANFQAGQATIQQNSWTLETWIRVAQLGSTGSAYVIGLEDGGSQAIISLSPQGEYVVQNADGSVLWRSNKYATPGKWQHLALQNIGRNSALFLDGMIVGLFAADPSWDFQLAVARASLRYDWQSNGISFSNLRVTNGGYYNQDGQLLAQMFTPLLPLPILPSTQVLVRTQSTSYVDNVNGIDRYYNWFRKPGTGAVLFLSVDPIVATVGDYQWY
jgi:hypothetical protein